MEWNKALWGIICILSLTIPLLLFNGAIDPFAPKHAVPIIDILEFGHVDPANNNIVCFSILGAVISLITTIDAFSLFLFPIQLIPIYILYYTLSYYLSNNHLVANLFSLIFVTQGTTGTPSTFFWPHGIGNILFLTVLIIVFSMYVNKFDPRKSIILLTLTISSLDLVSYDYIAILFLMALIAFVYVTLWVWKSEGNLFAVISPNMRQLRKLLLYAIILILILEMSLRSFVYDKFIPLFTSEQDLLISPIDKFLTKFQLISPPNPLSDLLLEVPRSIAQVALIKYGIVFLSLFVVIVCIKKHYQSSSRIPLIYLGTTIFQNISYGIVRILIGGTALITLYGPGITATNILARYSQLKFVKVWIALVVIVLLVANAALFGIRIDSNLINRDSNGYDYLFEFSNWYKNNAYGINFFSDEFTRNMINTKLYSSSSFHDIPHVKIIKSDLVLSILNRGKYNSDAQVILNYKINSYSIQNWNILKPWYLFQYTIDKNDALYKLYDSGYVGYYSYSSNK